jgi:hypothetical protein
MFGVAPPPGLSLMVRMINRITTTSKHILGLPPTATPCARIGMPWRVGSGPTEIEKLDIYADSADLRVHPRQQLVPWISQGL